MTHPSRPRHEALGSRVLVTSYVMATAALLATGLATHRRAAPETRQTPRVTTPELPWTPPRPSGSADDTFAPRGKAVARQDGAAHVRYDRTYRGLPVLGGDVVVHLTKSGTYDGGSVTLKRPLTLATTAKVSKADAIRTATAKLDGTVSSTEAREVVDAWVPRPPSPTR